MSRRPRQRSQHYDVDATITPDTALSVSLKQVIIIIAGIFVVASGYAFLVLNQQSTSKDVTEIKSSVNANAGVVNNIIRDQDDKRAQLAKEFLASNDKIVESVNKLTTLVAVQQERQKSTDEKLEKVLNQISGALGRK